MAKSIAGGLVNAGHPQDQIMISDPSTKQLDWYSRFPDLETTQDNEACVVNCDIVILSVKPQIMQQAVQGIASQFAQYQPLVISIAAGILIKDIIRWASANLSIIRVMPNTPALINSGVSGLFANSPVDEQQKSLAENIMQSVGATVWVDSESDIDTVTGISGSGPAYFFKLMEVMYSVAMQQGLSADAARTLVVQTALGAAKLAEQSDVGPEELRHRVTSPNGTTEAAINTMVDNGLESAIEHGIKAAIARSDELAKSLGES